VVLLPDEPSLGLAPKVIEELFAALDALRQESVTVLLVDQMAAPALSLADRAYVLETRRVVAHGTAQSLMADARWSRPTWTVRPGPGLKGLYSGPASPSSRTRSICASRERLATGQMRASTSS
jgi:energy-coupling factor transporter ATP-binding protein EcfA2